MNYRYIQGSDDLHKATTLELVLVFMPWYFKTIENTQQKEEITFKQLFNEKNRIE